MTDTTNAAMSMITCSECGKEVPEHNMTIHRAHACQGRARSATASEDDDNDNDDVIDLTSSASKKREDESPSTPPPSRRQRREMGRLKRDDDYKSDDNDDAMDVDSDDDSIEVLENNNNNNNNSVVEIDDDEWACPRCTLLNDNASNLCSMCGGTQDGAASAVPPSTPPRHDGVRAPDPVRRERLIGGDSPSGLSNNSPLSVVGGGALLGGVIGGMNAYMRGRPVSSGAFEGGVAGAVGGAFLSEYVGTPERSARRSSSYNREFQNDMAEARSSSVSGQPSYPSMGTAATRRSTRQPRSSFRVTQTTNPDGSRRFMVSESSRSGSLRYGLQTHNHDSDPLMSFLLASSLQGRSGARAAMGRGGDGLDNMNYDQLLSAFGDGTENLGASGRTLSSLPTHIVKTKPDGTIDLPQDARQCAICLEDFEKGETRKTLPCLHGFHENCVDKWCQSNGCCPICKYRVDQNSS